MTVYELIQELARYKPDAEMVFKLGSLEVDSITLTCGERSMNDEITDEIGSAPTIEPRRGEWGDTYKSGYKPLHGCVCTACDCWNDRNSNFCPYCGADMTGGTP